MGDEVVVANREGDRYVGIAIELHARYTADIQDVRIV